LNENVAQILNILMEKMSDEETPGKEELIQYLLDKGYPLEDIDAAFQLIFSQNNQQVIDLTPLAGIELSSKRRRIITNEERSQFTKTAYGVLVRLQNTGIFDLQKWEYLFITLFNEQETPIDCGALWEGLQKVLNEDELAILARSVPEFAPFMGDSDHYIN